MRSKSILVFSQAQIKKPGGFPGFPTFKMNDPAFEKKT